jgi:3-hydroxyacyl-CoA dehydrogenase
LEIKQDVFRRLDSFLRPGSVLASNTSYLDLDKIANATSRASTVVGLHFFSPANVMRLVEVVRGAATAPEVLATAVDVARRMRKSRAATRDPAARYVDIPDRLCELGRPGKKTLAGYYLYEAGSRQRKVDPLVKELIDLARAASGRPSRTLADQEIQRRAVLAMVNEAALLLAEGVAQRPDDVDVVMVNGFGFPRQEGGPVRWARKRARKKLEEDIDWLASLSGPGFVRGDLAYLWEGED